MITRRNLFRGLLGLMGTLVAKKLPTAPIVMKYRQPGASTLGYIYTPLFHEEDYNRHILKVASIWDGTTIESAPLTPKMLETFVKNIRKQTMDETSINSNGNGCNEENTSRS